MPILDTIQKTEKTYPELGKLFGSTPGPGQTMRSSDPNNIPVTNKDRIGEKIHNAISDIGTGVSTWGNSFRAPTEEEKVGNRTGWDYRSQFLAKQATQGMVNELTGGAISKVAGVLSKGTVKATSFIQPEVKIEAPAVIGETDAVKAKMAKFQAKIDASKAANGFETAKPNTSGIYNKAEVINHYLGSYPKGLGAGIKEDIMSKSKDEFSQFVKDKTNFQQTANHWIYSPSKLQSDATMKVSQAYTDKIKSLNIMKPE
jgi:hypothetical protein